MTDRPVDDGARPGDADVTDSTDQTASTDQTVDPATADSGPEATPEQDALVAGLLASLRADDPPMPDDVVRRLDAVLAEERRARLETAGVATLPVAAAVTNSDSADSAPSAVAAPVTVLPAREEREGRRGPGLRSFRVLGGVAAAVALVATGAFIGTQGLGGSSGTSGGSAPVVAAAGVPVADTATTYSKSALEQQARDLVGSLNTRAYSLVTPEALPQGAPAPETSTTGTASESPVATASLTSAASPAGDDGQVTGTELAGCLQELTGATDARPLVVDQGTYDGRAAEVLVLPSADQVGAVDVWVVAAGCRAGSVELLDFRRLALTSASPSS